MVTALSRKVDMCLDIIMSVLNNQPTDSSLEIPLRVFEPEKCEQCNTLYSMELETGCKMIAVITQEGT